MSSKYIFQQSGSSYNPATIIKVLYNSVLFLCTSHPFLALFQCTSVLFKKHWTFSPFISFILNSSMQLSGSHALLREIAQNQVLTHFNYTYLTFSVYAHIIFCTWYSGSQLRVLPCFSTWQPIFQASREEDFHAAPSVTSTGRKISQYIANKLSRNHNSAPGNNQMAEIPMSPNGSDGRSMKVCCIVDQYTKIVNSKSLVSEWSQRFNGCRQQLCGWIFKRQT